MISICTPFYPYYRQYDRSNELFDYFIPALNRADYSQMELVLCDCGICDIWSEYHRPPRASIQDFWNRLRGLYKGKLNYCLTNQGLTPDEHRAPWRFWMANAVNMSIKNSSHDEIFIMNIDIEVPSNFVEKYHENVKPGQVWFPKCYHIKRTDPRVEQNGGWRAARGLVGITKKDYWDVGGTDHVTYVKDRHDSDLYKRVVSKYNIVEGNLKDFYHIDHPGGNESSSEFKDNNPWTLVK
jgi:hypothetical protein